MGYQETVEDTWLLYLDPHTTQQSPVSVNNNMPFEQFDKSLHTDKLCWIKALKLDPSLAVGFFFNTVEEFILWTKVNIILLTVIIIRVQLEKDHGKKGMTKQKYLSCFFRFLALFSIVNL